MPGLLRRASDITPRQVSVNKGGQPSSTGREAVDDRDLVEAARAGDRDAFRLLFERYHRRAYALALGVVRHPDDALDVVQDAFIKAHKYLDKFEGNSSFYTWLYRIVMNLAIDHLRKHKRVKPVELDEERMEAPGPMMHPRRWTPRASTKSKARSTSQRT